MKKGFAPIIILLILVVVALMGVAYLAGTKGILSTKTSLVSYSSPSPIPSPTSGPTTNWTEYLRYADFYTFRYPKSWLVEQIIGTTRFNDFHYSVDIKNSVRTYGPEPSAIRVVYWDNPNSLSLQEFEKSHQTSFGSIGIYNANEKPTMFAGVDSFYEENGNCEPLTCNRYIVPANHKIFIVSIYTDGYTNTVKNDKAEIDQILSTFKFTK